jgi:hypothetical protein
LMGIGQGKGKTRAVDAAMSAISSPLLDFPISKAKGIVFNIVGGPDMTLQEINSAAEVVYEAVDADANIIFGALIDDKITTGEVSITVLATGFATDFFDSEGELGTGEGLESLQPLKVPTPKTVVGARQFAEKTYIPSGLDDKIAYDGAAPTRQKISSDRAPSPSQDKRAAPAVRSEGKVGDNRIQSKRQTRRNEDDVDDDDDDDDDVRDKGAARENQRDRERESDPKRYKGIRGFFRRIFD